MLIGDRRSDAMLRQLGILPGRHRPTARHTCSIGLPAMLSSAARLSDGFDHLESD
jgi:hypothetical protein